MGQIKEIMDANNGLLKHAVVVPRVRGQLRLVIRCRNDSHQCWSMSVILYSVRFDGRIDCIDWEGLFVTKEGSKASGFHRHIWNPEQMDCEKSKVPLPKFQPTCVEQFILQGFELLRVTHEPDLSGGYIQW